RSVVCLCITIEAGLSENTSPRGVHASIRQGDVIASGENVQQIMLGVAIMLSGDQRKPSHVVRRAGTTHQDTGSAWRTLEEQVLQKAVTRSQAMRSGWSALMGEQFIACNGRFVHGVLTSKAVDATTERDPRGSTRLSKIRGTSCENVSNHLGCVRLPRSGKGRRSPGRHPEVECSGSRRGTEQGPPWWSTCLTANLRYDIIPHTSCFESAAPVVAGTVNRAQRGVIAGMGRGDDDFVCVCDWTHQHRLSVHAGEAVSD
ncbi:unnamed protein product, partial [Pleuronectes platessa]